MKNETRKIVFFAAFIALVCVATFIHVQIPLGLGIGGLVHLGTFMSFAIALKYGKNYGALASGIGMGLFDILTGYAIWAPGTFIIRLVSGYLVGHYSQSAGGQGVNRMKNLFAMAIGGIVIILGYYIYEVILVMNWITPLGSILGNVIQIIVGYLSIFILSDLPALETDQSSQ